MLRRTADVNYQDRARGFQVGMAVVPINGNPTSDSGRVTAVYPGIGMVDVEMATGNQRFPAEDLLFYNRQQSNFDVPKTPSEKGKDTKKLATNVVHAYIKRAIYWASADRKYKASQGEIDSGQYGCPKCKESTLKRAVYKRMDGKSERLLGCPGCMFLIRAKDLDGCHYHCPDDTSGDEVVAY